MSCGGVGDGALCGFDVAQASWADTAQLASKRPGSLLGHLFADLVNQEVIRAS